MTKNEAIDRAKKIWPGRKITVSPREYDRGAWVIDLGDDGVSHVIDVNGHTDCHKVCADLEAKLP